jgi:hypothetical protein
MAICLSSFAELNWNSLNIGVLLLLLEIPRQDWQLIGILVFTSWLSKANPGCKTIEGS